MHSTQVDSVDCPTSSGSDLNVTDYPAADDIEVDQNSTASITVTSTSFSDVNTALWANDPLLVIISIFVGIIVTFVLLGNALTLVTFITYRRLRRRKYIPVASLAVADILVGLSAILFLCNRFVLERLHGDTYQTTELGLMMAIYLSTSASGYHLVVMAIDRFVAARFPFQYRWMMTTSRIAAMTAACWIASMLTTAPYLVWLSPEIRSSTNRLETCYHFGGQSGPVPLYFVLPLQLSLWMFVCLSVIVLTLIVCSIIRRKDRIQGDVDGGVIDGRLHSTAVFHKYKMVTGIMVAYVVCWLPYITVQCAQMISLQFCRSYIARTLQMIVGELGIVNSGINIIIYALMNADFRHAYQDVLRCRGRRLGRHTSGHVVTFECSSSWSNGSALALGNTRRFNNDE